MILKYLSALSLDEIALLKNLMTRREGMHTSLKSNTETVCLEKQVVQRTYMIIDLGFQFLMLFLFSNLKIEWK